MQWLPEGIFYSSTIVVQKYSLSRLYLYDYHSTSNRNVFDILQIIYFLCYYFIRHCNNLEDKIKFGKCRNRIIKNKLIKLFVANHIKFVLLFI